MLVHIVEFALGPHALPYCVSLELTGQLLLLIGVLLYCWALILHRLELLKIAAVSIELPLRHEGRLLIAIGYWDVGALRDYVRRCSWWPQPSRIQSSLSKSLCVYVADWALRAPRRRHRLHIILLKDWADLHLLPIYPLTLQAKTTSIDAFYIYLIASAYLSCGAALQVVKLWTPCPRRIQQEVDRAAIV